MNKLLFVLQIVELLLLIIIGFQRGFSQLQVAVLVCNIITIVVLFFYVKDQLGDPIQREKRIEKKNYD